MLKRGADWQERADKLCKDSRSVRSSAELHGDSGIASAEGRDEGQDLCCGGKIKRAYHRFSVGESSITPGAADGAINRGLVNESQTVPNRCTAVVRTARPPSS